ncbi:MAG: hypothetical protein AB7L13_24730 [Acidimicrobiia bacterium]
MDLVRPFAQASTTTAPIAETGNGNAGVVVLIIVVLLIVAGATLLFVRTRPARRAHAEGNSTGTASDHHG